MNNDLINNNILQEEENFNIKKEVSLLWFFWPWFVLTI